jgi:uncharacterized ion transporter superfamily protein YfcC
MDTSTAQAKKPGASASKPVPTGEKKKKHKSPNAFAILFCLIVAVALLSWFIPGGAYKTNAAGHALAGTYHTVKATPQGIWDVLMAPMIGMVGSDTITGAISISLFIFVFGSFLEMMNSSGCIKKALKVLAVKNEKNIHVLIWILVFIMSFLGTVEGAYDEDIIYIILFLPIFLSLGADSILACMIVIMGTQIGCLASVIDPFAVGIASGIAGISMGEGIGWRAIIFVLMTSLVAVMCCKYSDFIIANPQKSTQWFRREEDVKEFPVSTGEDLTFSKSEKRALIVFVVMLVIMVVGLIPWTSVNKNWTFFNDLAKAIGGNGVSATLIGSDVTALGSWSFNELSMLLAVSTFVAGFLLHYSVSKSMKIFLDGAAGLVAPAFIVPAARGIQVVMDNGQITPTILHFGEITMSTLPPWLFVLVALVFYFAFALLIPSSSGLAAATMSIMSGLATFAHIPVYLMIIIYCMGLGLAKLITPTSVAVMTVTSAAHVDYGVWVKHILPYLGILFAVCCVFLEVMLLFI